MHSIIKIRTNIFFAILLAVSSVFLIATPHSYAQEETPPAKGVIQGQAAEFEEMSAGDFGCFSTEKGKALFDGCLGLLGYTFLKAGAWAAVWVSVGLNFIVAELVVGMGQLVGNMPGITVAWEVFRDLANIFLVGLTVYIGISTIVGAGGYASKQLLSRVILAALLVNFSMTLAKVVIDVSNVTAITAYQMILNANDTTSDTTVVGVEECSQPLQDNTDVKESTCINTGIAGVFWSQLQVTKIFNVHALKEKSQEAGTTGVPSDALFFVGIMGGVMFFVMAFVFGAAAFMLATRFIILLFLIVLSPLAFVFWITGASGQGKAWWHALLNQALVAPTLFLTWWVAFKVFADIAKRFNIDEKGLAGSAMADVGGIAIATFFFITTGLLIASLILTKELGARGASSAMSTGQRWTKQLGMGAYAVTGGVAMKHAGRGYNKVIAMGERSKREREEKHGESLKAANSRLSSAQASGDRRAETMARDEIKQLMEKKAAMQNLSTVKNLATFGQLKTGSLLDRSIAGGFKAAAKPWTDTEEASEKRGKEISTKVRTSQLSSAITGTGNADKDKKTIGSITSRDAEELHDVIMGNVAQIKHISASTYEGIMKSEKFDEDEKGKLRSVYYETQIDSVTGKDDPTLSADENENRRNARKQVRQGLREHEVSAMHDEIMSNPNVVNDFTPDQFTSLMNNKSYNETEREALKKIRFEDIQKATDDVTALHARKAGGATINDAEFDTANQKLKDALKNVSEAEAGTLGTLLENEHVITNMAQSLATKLQDSTKVASSTKGKIRTVRQSHFQSHIDANTMDKALKGMKPQDYVKGLSPEQLYHKNTVKHMNTAVLSEMKDVPVEVRDKVRTEITSLVTSGGLLTRYENRVKAGITSESATQGRPLTPQEVQMIENGAMSGLTTDEQRHLSMYKYVTNPTTGSLF